jgi:spore coat protein H
MLRLTGMNAISALRLVCCLVLAGACAVHAASYRPKATPAGEDLFMQGVVPRLAIEIPPDSLEVLRDYKQVWRQARPKRIDVQITIREGKSVYTNVAVHLKGSYSFRPIDDKPSMTLNFDKFAPGQRFHGLEKIHLNNSVQDPSYLLEQFARELFIDTGVPTTRAGHVFVSINGRDAGLYVLIEGWNKQFVKRHFESAKGNLYDGGSGGDVTKRLKVDCGENPEDRSDLTNLVRTARITNPSNRLAQLQRVLDVERFRTFAALEMMLVHWDGYCAGGPNNYRLFHDVARDKMVFMPHGMDQLFGISASTDYSILPAFKGVVANGLFGIPAERQRYRERVAELLANEFSEKNLHTRLDRLQKRLQPALANEPRLRAQIDTMVRNTKSRMSARVASIERQLKQSEQSFVFDASGAAPLTNWRFKGANDHPATGTRGVENQKQMLLVRAANNDEFSSGAWRSVVLLQPGHYEFSGLGRAVGADRSATNTGIILRISGERSLKGLTTNDNWTPLRYEFDVHGVENKELVCEFRGAQGGGLFDISTLKLARKGPPRAAPVAQEEEE